MTAHAQTTAVSRAKLSPKYGMEASMSYYTEKKITSKDRSGSGTTHAFC
jgi:hypothetical protein